jgi:hypothetical protein
MTEDFWDWLPKAYGEVNDDPVFTKYNMEVAFAAGAEAEAKRMWVGLTGDEVNEFSAGCHLGNSVQGAIRAAEARLKEKNHG